MEYVLNHGMESSHRINNIQAKAEHTEQVKIENTELRLRVNDLETQLHDIQLKYQETKSRERKGFDWLLARIQGPPSPATNRFEMVPEFRKCSGLTWSERFRYVDP